MPGRTILFRSLLGAPLLVLGCYAPLERRACAANADCDASEICRQGFCQARGGESDGPIFAPTPSDGATAESLDAQRVRQTLLFGERTGADISTVTIDTTLHNQHTKDDHNFGGEPFVACSSAPAEVTLLRFDLSRIPPGSRVQRAALSLFTAQGFPSGTVYVFAALEPWREGIGRDQDGTANWQMRSPGVRWSTPGAGAPGSRGEIAIAQFLPPAADHVEIDVPLETATVQAWVDQPATNQGLVLALLLGARGTFHSRESLDTGYRPALWVTFVAP
jgi:hypothetical protein